jgi:hypothetical protein
MTASTPMSARDLRNWLLAAEGELAAVGVFGSHGAGPRLVADGSTWISFSSRWGSGRLVRAVDGSSESRAHRYRDGVTVVDSRSASTTEAQLDVLTHALQRPAAPVG